MNYKNERILKLYLKGYTPEQIARKTGLSVERVAIALVWLRMEHRID